MTAVASPNGIRASRGSVRAIAAWLTPRYSWSGFSPSCDAAMHALPHSRIVASPNSAASSLSSRRISSLKPRTSRAATASGSWRVEHDVRHRDREVGDAIAVDHVAEVDDAGDALAARLHVRVAADENVVVVRVAVDDGARKPIEKRRRVSVESVGERVDRRAELGVDEHRPLSRDDRARVGDVPIEVAMNRRMVEVRKAPRRSRRAGGRGLE